MGSPTPLRYIISKTFCRIFGGRLTDTRDTIAFFPGDVIDIVVSVVIKKFGRQKEAEAQEGVFESTYLSAAGTTSRLNETTDNEAPILIKCRCIIRIALPVDEGSAKSPGITGFSLTLALSSSAFTTCISEVIFL